MSAMDRYLDTVARGEDAARRRLGYPSGDAPAKGVPRVPKGPAAATKRSREQAAYIAMLEDTVVAAATVIFGGGTGPQDEGYLTEGIYEQAQDIITNVPRLAGAWNPPEG